MRCQDVAAMTSNDCKMCSLLIAQLAPASSMDSLDVENLPHIRMPFGIIFNGHEAWGLGACLHNLQCRRLRNSARAQQSLAHLATITVPAEEINLVLAPHACAPHVLVSRLPNTVFGLRRTAGRCTRSPAALPWSQLLLSQLLLLRKQNAVATAAASEATA
jgi:hypothetical protein